MEDLQIVKKGIEDQIQERAEGSEFSDIELNVGWIRSFREKKLNTIRSHIEHKIGGHIRRQQSLILYFLNLIVPMILTGLNAYILLALGINSELKGKLIIAFVILGFIVAIVSNLQIAPPLEILKLYFHIDTLIPVLASSIIGFFAIFNFLSTGQWYQHGFAVCYPVWVFYYAGCLRVMIAYLSWTRWKVVTYKLAVLGCGLTFFYVGFDYMDGAYKVTEGYFPQIEDTIKDTVLLYVFGTCELFFQYYRKLSSFDQTQQLKYVYHFQDHHKDQDEAIIEANMQILQEQFIAQEQALKDQLESRKHNGHSSAAIRHHVVIQI